MNTQIFKDLNYESIVEYPSMNVYDLLANIGGTFGLFIGACVLTLVEFVQLIFALIGCKPARRRRRSSTPMLLRPDSATNNVIVDLRRRQEVRTVAQNMDNSLFQRTGGGVGGTLHHRNNVLPPVMPIRVE